MSVIVTVMIVIVISRTVYTVYWRPNLHITHPPSINEGVHVHAYYTRVLIAIIVCILTTTTLVVEAVLFLHFCDASKSKQRLKEEATLLASGGLLLDHTVHWSQKVVPEGRKGRVRSYKNASSSSKMAENAALVPRKSSQPPQVPSSP